MSGILVAGIGNIFQGDDGFGVEVAQRLSRMSLSRDVNVVDFGIRGIDLTYALMDDYAAVVLVDAASRGKAPGTLSLIEPETASAEPLDPGQALLSAHDLDPAKVMRLVTVLGGGCRRVLLLACEPLDCGGEDGRLGLSDTVKAAVEPAIAMISALINEIRVSTAEAA